MMLAALAVLLSAVAPALRAETPRLAVLIVVDQMRADYFARFGGEFTGGFARLAREGAVYGRARQAHVPTETAPGHATISTGREPHEHGILANDWWDRARGRSTYCVEDPDFGVSPRNLRVPALADAIKEANPASKVAAVSGKDRVAILLGGHHPDAAFWYDRSGGVFTTTGYYGAVPRWLLDWDAAHTVEGPARESVIATTRIDRLTLDLARRAVEELGMGQDVSPDLLAVGLSATDYLGHAKGPQDPAMHEHLLALDKELGEFLKYLDDRVGAGNYTVALTADHGAQFMPESEEGKGLGMRRVMVKDFAAPVEEGLKKKFGEPSGGASWLVSVIPPHVLVNRASARAKGIPEADLVLETAKLFRRSPDVARVFLPEELKTNKKLAGYAEDFRRSYDEAGSGDVLVLVQPRLLVTNSPVEAGHSLPYDEDARVPMILFGEGVRPGRYDREVTAAELAPTLAQMLGVSLAPRPGARVFSEALAAGARTGKGAAPAR